MDGSALVLTAISIVGSELLGPREIEFRSRSEIQPVIASEHPSQAESDRRGQQSREEGDARAVQQAGELVPAEPVRAEHRVAPTRGLHLLAHLVGVVAHVVGGRDDRPVVTLEAGLDMALARRRGSSSVSTNKEIDQVPRDTHLWVFLVPDAFELFSHMLHLAERLSLRLPLCA